MALGELTWWLITYFPVAWTAHICQGLAMGIFGPTQPYLAQNVGVPSHQINLIWTLRAFGSCFATIITGMVFKSRIRSRNNKLLFLAVCVLLTGCFIGLVPWMHTFELLLTAVLLAGIFIGSLDTASNSLVLYMLGPDKSPPFTQSLHAFVGMGFVFGSLIVRPFLPEAKDNSSVCSQAEDENDTHVDINNISSPIVEETVPTLAWPFLIISIIHLCTAIGYSCIILGGIPMPQYYEAVAHDEKVDQHSKDRIKPMATGKMLITFFLAFLYFSFSCGLEGFFQSQTFTFGICGPHAMTPGTAAALTTVYFTSFLAGRFSGVLISTRLKPSTMILTSLTCCILSAILLVFTAESSQESLFFGTGAIGFFVSLQFASGYSWLAEQVDLTGRGSSVVFLGANFGWLVFPPLAGWVVFSSVGPMGVYYLTLGLTTSHLLLFLIMLKMSSSLF